MSQASWLELKYIQMMSPHLDRFKRVGNNYNMRCPVCGDSKKSKSKARGWIFSSTSGLRFYCHNCTASMPFPQFLKFVNSTLYYDYVKDNFGEQEKEKSDLQEFVDKMKKPEYVKTTNIKNLKKISQLDPSHPAKLYVEKRQIPSNMHHKLFYAPKFKSWVNSIIPEKFNEAGKDEPRLIIPFLNENKELIGFQGRSFKKDDPLKYITIMLTDDPKIFGLDTLNKSERIYTFEGPIDAMFIENSIASAGGRLDTNLETANLDKSKCVLVYDNEPRSPETIKKIQKSIKLGYQVCIWPENLMQKDINDMILAGSTAKDIKQMIDSNTYSGLTAEFMLTARKRI
jgi:hypothetical protein